MTVPQCSSDRSGFMFVFEGCGNFEAGCCAAEKDGEDAEDDLCCLPPRETTACAAVDVVVAFGHCDLLFVMALG